MRSFCTHLTPVHAACRIRATPLSVVRKNSLFQLPAALLSTFFLWNSAPPLIIALLTAFDHVDTRFTPLSCHVYSILDVRVLTLIMNVRAPHSLSHALDDRFHHVSICINFVVRGPLPIHLHTLSRVVSLSHKYSRSTSVGVACNVRATAANSAVVSWLMKPKRLKSMHA
jgi:hypothetical protein